VRLTAVRVSIGLDPIGSLKSTNLEMELRMFEHPIHPIVVHFPIALLFTAVLFEFLGLLKRRDEYRRFGHWLLMLGMVAGLVAAGFGWWGEGAVKAAGVPGEAIDRHESFAVASLIAFGLLLIFRRWARDRWSPRGRAIYLALAVAGLLLLAATGYFGGDLVYRYGAGVQKPGSIAPAVPETPSPAGLGIKH
jgi:uncharacterized membrane protein